MQLIPIAFIIVLAVFMNRQQRKRVLLQQMLVSSLATGDMVVTTSGLYGTIRGTDSETFSLEIAEHVVVRIAKGAVARKTQGLVPEATQ